MLLHGGGHAPTARWPYVLARPEEICIGAGRARIEAFVRRRSRPRPRAKTAPFEGGVAGVFCYEYYALLDPAMPQVSAVALPDSALGYYPSVAAFDHLTKRAFVFAKTTHAAEQLAATLGEDIVPTGAEGSVAALDSSVDYRRQVAVLIEAIRAGDLLRPTFRGASSANWAAEAVQFNSRGDVAGCAAGNIFVVLDGRLTTPPIWDGALPGTMRAHVLEQGLEIDVHTIHAADLVRAEAIAVTNALQRVRIAAHLNGRALRLDHPSIAALTGLEH